MPGADFDVIIVGGGIAGASAAYFLSASRNVLLLEKESAPGYHATGRSGAIWVASYGNEAVRALNRATGPFLISPPEEFATVPLVGPPCGVMTLAGLGDGALLDDIEKRPDRTEGLVRMTPAQAKAHVSILRQDRLAGAIFDPDARMIDVDALLQAYLRGAKKRRAQIWTDAEVTGLKREGGLWQVDSQVGPVCAPIVVNAAGAWAGRVAALAGARPITVLPMRRTGVIVDAPEGAQIGGWPLVLDARETFYFKPDAGKLMLSPADETPSEPMDAFPDEMDVAVAIDRVQQMADLPVRRVNHAWAGLRTFSPDRTPIVGFDTQAKGFFWLAGQGGYGLQTSAALGAITAALIGGEALGDELIGHGVDLAALVPGRFA